MTVGRKFMYRTVEQSDFEGADPCDAVTSNGFSWKVSREFDVTGTGWNILRSLIWLCGLSIGGDLLGILVKDSRLLIAVVIY